MVADHQGGENQGGMISVISALTVYRAGTDVLRTMPLKKRSTKGTARCPEGRPFATLVRELAAELAAACATKFSLAGQVRVPVLVT
jgi:hypothetical protein